LCKTFEYVQALIVFEDEKRAFSRGILFHAAAFPRGACTLIGLGHRRFLELREPSLSIRAGRSDVKLFFCSGRLNPGLLLSRPEFAAPGGVLP
jgi:hypothetical protein